MVEQIDAVNGQEVAGRAPETVSRPAEVVEPAENRAAEARPGEAVEEPATEVFESLGIGVNIDQTV